MIRLPIGRPSGKSPLKQKKKNQKTYDMIFDIILSIRFTSLTLIGMLKNDTEKTKIYN